MIAERVSRRTDWFYRGLVERGIIRKHYFHGNKTVPYYALSEVTQALTPQPEEADDDQ